MELYGDLRRHYRKGQEALVLELAAGATAGEVLRGLGVEEGEIWQVAINGEIARRDAPLRDGDVITVFPPVGGG